MLARLATLAVAAGILQACASTGIETDTSDRSQRAGPENLVGGVRGEPVGDELARFLSDRPGRASTTLGNSRWGSGARVTAASAYFAASGRRCRQLIVDSPDRSEPVRRMACRAEEGWVTHRPVTMVVDQRERSR